MVSFALIAKVVMLYWAIQRRPKDRGLRANMLFFMAYALLFPCVMPGLDAQQHPQGEAGPPSPHLR